MKFKKAFTLLEIIFVILILGILSSLVLPFISQNKEDALWLKLKMDYEMLNSSLSLMRHEAKLKNLSYLSILDNAKIGLEKQNLFFCTEAEILSCQGGANCCSYSLLQSPIFSNSKAWIKIGQKEYRFYLNARISIDFVYDESKGILECKNSKLCENFL